MNDPDRRAAIRPWSSLIAHRRWRITSNVTGSRPASAGAATIRRPARCPPAPALAGAGHGAEADRQQVVDLRAEARRDDDAVSHALDDRRAVDHVARVEGCAVVDLRRDEPGRLEVGLARALVRAGGVRARVRVLGERDRVDPPRSDDAVELDLVAAAEQQRALAVHLAVALEEAIQHALARRGVERPGIDLDLDGVHLLAEAHAQRAGERDLRGRRALALELLHHARLERLEALRQRREALGRERGADDARDLGGVRDVARQHPLGAEDGGVGEHEDRLRADLVAVEDGVRRAGAAVGDEHALARVVALLDRRLADQVRHLRVDDPEDPDRAGPRPA